MDTIFIEDLTVIGKHGVMEHEWSEEQRFLVDISINFDTRASGVSDNLKESVDYVRLCKIAQKVIQGRSVYLVEKLASLIADEILEDKRIQKVTISIRKPSVLPSGVPGVTIVREQG